MFKRVPVSWGSDPEGFFIRNGHPIGSEKLITPEGYVFGFGRIVRDGVQFELNPNQGSIQQVGNNIGRLLTQVNYYTRIHPGVSVGFGGMVEVPREELDSLSPGCRVLGCQPSLNAYEDRPILVDTATYRKRSAGGHIHVGISHIQDLMQERNRLVPLFDTYVGNTCVLLDRDPNAAERRENYGRAGEHRLPDHGIEYRTTSNFWLRDYALMEFVFGMAEVAVSALDEALSGRKSIMAETIKRIDISRVVKAIDTNSFDLAMENFLALVPVLHKNLPDNVFPLDKTNIKQFIGLAENINRNGIEQLLPTTHIFTRWISANKEGFRAFLNRV